jgi:uncharacterized membrane protein YciS (DUF1049 family)
MTAIRWLVVDAVTRRADPGWAPSQTLPLVNAQMALAAAIAAAGWWGYRSVRRAGARVAVPRSARAVQIVVICGAVFFLLALSFEADHLIMQLASLGAPVWWSTGHVRHLTLTLLWSLGGLGMAAAAAIMVRPAAMPGAAAGTARPPMLLICFAWAVLAICVFKWIVVDTLFFTIWLRRAATNGFLPLLNLQMIVGAVLAGSALLLVKLSRASLGRHADRDTWRLGPLLTVAASIILLWGLTFEIDRAIARMDAAGTLAVAWTPSHLRALLWTALWATGGMGMMLIGRWRGPAAMLQAGWVVVVGAAMAWLSADTLGFRVSDGVVSVPMVLNLQFGVGLIAAATLAGAAWLVHRLDAAKLEQLGPSRPQLMPLSLVLLGAVGLWLGSLELDRVFADQPMARQTAWSVFWCVYGVLLVLLGFLKRQTAARYAGLGLLALTGLKVVIVDLSQVEQAWRVVSFLVFGLLLIGTSVVYTKLTPRILGEDRHEGTEARRHEGVL